MTNLTLPEIKSNNPIPSVRGGGRASIYREYLSKFNPGDNVYISDKKLFGSLYSAAGSYGRKHNKTFASRTEIVKGKKRYGLWRVK